MQALAIVHVGIGDSACRHRREHDEPDGNILSRGEGTPSPAWSGEIDQAQATRHK